MKKLLFAFTSLALASGCGGGGVEEVLGKMRGYKDRLCKCTDQACVDKIEEEAGKWAMANMEKLQKLEKDATKAQKEAFEKLDDEMDKCKEKVEGGGAAPAPTP